MFIIYTHLADGPGPSEAIVEIQTSEGKEEIIVDKDILNQGAMHVGSAIAVRGNMFLLELPREAVSGRTRVWVNKSATLREKQPA